VIIGELRERFERAADKTLFVSDDGAVTYRAWLDLVARADVGATAPGDVVPLRIEPTPASLATLWALFERQAIVTLLGRASAAPAAPVDHPLYAELRRRGHPGFVLLSSGTSAEPKAAVHDATQFLGKFARPGKDLRTLLFLPPDHVGGLDTLFYAMANTSTLVLPRSRGVDDVCAAIARHRAQVLPANPSFLGLLLVQRAYQHHDLSSLTTITYGAEVMPQVTLDRLAEAFPNVTLRQKYGSTEFGALASSSRDQRSLFVRLGGGDVQTRVVGGVLHVKSPTTLLGYLNAPSPLTEDGWVNTGDLVEQDGDYYRILGRASELINVGGEKVSPAEVESVVLEMSGVTDAMVYAEPNALLGQIVAADVVYAGEERGAALATAVRRHCASRLPAHKVPSRVRQVDAIAMGAHKRARPR
jgi:acyl-CoA synthetase (AMP-forming)/AMP-acid ligase II